MKIAKSLRNLFSFVRSLYSARTWELDKSPVGQPAEPIRRIVDTNAIRARIKGLGWQLKELPIRRTDPATQTKVIMQWKLVAIKGDKSLEVGGSSLDEAMSTMGRTLGVIAQK